MKFFALLFISLFFLLSCNKDTSKIDQDKIFQSYEMTYDEDNGQTSFYASFHKENAEGKVLPLGKNSTITINGEPMNRLKKTYGKTFEGQLTSGTFVFTDEDGKTYTNTIMPAQPISNGTQTHVNSGVNTYWHFDGAPIGSGEAVTVYIYSYADEGGSSVSKSTEAGATSVLLRVADMSTLVSGQGILSIKRSVTFTNGNWTNAGGKKVSNYIPTTQQITIN